MKGMRNLTKNLGHIFRIFNIVFFLYGTCILYKVNLLGSSVFLCYFFAGANNVTNSLLFKNKIHSICNTQKKFYKNNTKSVLFPILKKFLTSRLEKYSTRNRFEINFFLHSYNHSLKKRDVKDKKD